MKFNKTLTLLFVVLVIGLLSACGSSSNAVGGLKSGEIKEISYDELIEKLDNEESFLLLSYYREYDDLVNSGLSEVIKERLEEHGVGAYYVRSYLSKEDEGKNKELRKYVHPENEKNDGKDFWNPTNDGLVYVTEGKVNTLTSSQVFIENSSTTPFGTQMKIDDVSKHDTFATSVSQSLMEYESFDFE